MAEVNFKLISARGEILPLSTDRDTDSGDFWMMSSPLGFGVPVPETRTQTSAGDGVRYASKRVKERTLTIRMGVSGSQRATTEANLRKLASMLRTEDGKPLPRLQALYNTGMKVELPFIYQAGGESTYGEFGPTSVEWPVTLLAPDPFWKAAEWEQIASMGPVGTTTDLLANLSALPLASSSVLGAVTITNLGDVVGLPVWEWYGPATSLTITTELGSFTYTGIAAGETRIFDTGAKTVVDAAGVNKYAGLATAPKFGGLPPGNSSVTITATGTDSTSRLIGRYKPRYELVH